MSDSVCLPILTIQLTLAGLTAIGGIIIGVVKYRSRNGTGNSTDQGRM